LIQTRAPLNHTRAAACLPDGYQVHAYIAICMKRHPEVPEWEEIAAVACGVQNMALQVSWSCVLRFEICLDLYTVPPGAL
jgi:hypothetical protein